MERVSIVCFLASYILALASELTRLRGRIVWGRIATLVIAAAGFFAHTAYLLNRAQQTHLPPLLSSLHDWLLVLAWLVVLMYLFITLLDRDLAIGFVAWPVAAALIVAANFAPAGAGSMANAYPNWTMLHVSLLVFGIAGVVLGFIVSLMYLWQHRRLKHGHVGHGGLALPSLERLERWNRWSLLTSVPLLTFGMIIGIGLTMARRTDVTDEWVWLDPLVVVSGVCWVLMTGVFVWLLSQKRTPGKQVAWLTAWACGFLLLTTVGSQLLVRATNLPSVHGATKSVEGGRRKAEGGRKMENGKTAMPSGFLLPSHFPLPTSAFRLPPSEGRH
jgi:ABC-type uncharacterized transport system permease subunit